MKSLICQRSLGFGAILILILSVTAAGQKTNQYDAGTPPQHMAGVSAIGSYTSAELGTVNLSNGSLNFRIPLGTVGGRGFSIPLTLNYSSKLWSASKDEDEKDGVTHRVAYADFEMGDVGSPFDHRLGLGWTIGGTPTLRETDVRIDIITSGPNVGCPSFRLAKLTLSLPDKGEIQFRDDATDGAPLPTSGCSGNTASRGVRWHATDGSGMIFINDVNGGVQAWPVPNLAGEVITAEGTRYRFNAGGLCESITDRHGNRITISGTTYTDQLGRVTTIQLNSTDPQTGAPLAALVTMLGYDGQPRYYKIKSGVLNEHFRSDLNIALPVVSGNYDPLSKYTNWPPPGTVLFPLSYKLYQQRIDDRDVVTEVVLPNNTALRFKYNQFGEVAQAEMPHGGKVQYDYLWSTSLPAGNSFHWETSGDLHTSVTGVDRVLKVRRIYPDGETSSTPEATYTYGYTVSAVTVVARSGDTMGPIVLNQRHLFLEPLRYTHGTVFSNPDGSYYSKWTTGVEWRTETLDAAGNVIAATEQDWTQRAPVAWSTYAQEQPENDNRVNQVRKYLDTGAMAKVETFYDLFNNPTEVKEYDFDQSLKRRTVTSYSSTELVNGTNYTADSIRLIRLPIQQSIYDAAEVEQGRTTYEYDIYAADGNRDSLISYPSITGHDTVNYGTNRLTRGNVTRIGNWSKTTDSYLYTYPRYDIAGNVVSTKDPRGNVTSVSFTDDFGNGANPGGGAQGSHGATYAFPTLVTSPPPNPGEQPHTARSQYDFSTGLLTGFKDRNDIITQTIYDDPFNRPTQVKSALGITGVENHAAMYYAPASNPFGITLTKNDMLTARDLTTLDDGVLRSWTKTDGFGRTIEGWSRDPQGDVKVATIYDPLGRTKQVSNPYRPSLGETPVYTTTSYDLAGRVISVTTPDNASVKTAYSGNRVLVADQNISDDLRRKRISETDALGRLKTVWEITAADQYTEDVSFPNWPSVTKGYKTTYEYDALDNLKQVTQGTQPARTFGFDSLKRLTATFNPESGNVGYSYDANGNLTQKVDARGVTSTYVYDALNRNTTVTYNDGTPSVTRVYDQAANGKGRLYYHHTWSADASKNSLTVVDIYDALGRPKSWYQKFWAGGDWGAPYYMSASYDLAGHLKTMRYPSGRTITNTYDNAGRLQRFAGNLGDGTPRTYATGISYSSFGGMSREQYGTQTPLYNKTFYNIRGQMWNRSLSSVDDLWNWNRGRIIWYYEINHILGGSGPDNNGNLIYQDTWIPPANQVGDEGQFLIQDSYSYDALNRLSAVNESTLDIAGGGSWTPRFAQAYTYDRYGNRTLNHAGTWGAGINNTAFDTNEASATNRLYAPGDTALPMNQRQMRYDSAGNLTYDAHTGQGARTYDAENRMVSSAGSLSATYVYDADGHRVKRIVGTTETRQIYGIGGELLAEYAANAAPSNPQKEYGYRNGELLITAEATTTATRTNVALAANGGVASASTAHTCCGFSVGGAVNGIITGSWGNGEGWNDATPNELPDWFQVDFAGAKTINEIDVFSLHDDYTQPNTPTETQTFILYGLVNFELQYWDGSAWATVPGGNVTGNNKVWRKFAFAPVTTSKIRLWITGVPDSWSRLVELQAWEGSGGSAFSFTDDPLVVGVTPVRAVHLNELRTAVNQARARAGLPAASWTDEPAQANVTWIKAAHVAELRTKLDEARASLLLPPASYTDSTLTPGTTTIKAAHIQELRTKTNEALTAGGGGGSSAIVKWLVADHLGTPRMVFDQGGSLANVSRHDYLPFGEEVPAGFRTGIPGYATGDNVRQKFTQKERDNETGLDFFEARYFGSMQGRFTSVDPYNPIVDSEDKDEFNQYLGQPQNWNRYVYVWNNPLRYIDPFGEKVYVVTYTYGNSEGDEEFKRAAETKANHLRNQKGFDPRKDTVLVKGVYKKEDFAAVLKEANSLQKQFGKVEQVALYSHAGANDGPVFHDQNGNPTQFSQGELSSLRVNWSNSAIAKFYGCYTSPNFGQNFANAQGVTTYGYDKFAYFSNRHDKMVPDQGGGRPLYLIAADYGDANGVDAAIRYQLGMGRVYPMVRHNPPVRRRPRR